MQTELTKELIERAFDEMGALAAVRGITTGEHAEGRTLVGLCDDPQRLGADGRRAG